MTKRSITAAVRSSYSWNLLSITFTQAASLVVFIALSRALPPTIFGIFALAALIVDFMAEQGRWAASDAIVQRNDYSPAALATGFYSLQALCTVLAIALALTAGFFAHLMGEPRVAYVLPALSLTLLLIPGIAVMDAIILGQLNYRVQALRSMAAVAVGGTVGLFVAFGPAAEWALVAQRLTGLGVNFIVLYLFTRWRPASLFNSAKARDFMLRVVRLWWAASLSTVHWRITQASVGIRVGTEAAGLLLVALRLDGALHGPTTSPIQSLWVPMLSAVRADISEAWRLFLRLSQITSLITLPAFVGFGLVGADFVAVVLDDRYRGVGDLLFVLGMQGFIIPIGFFSNLVFAGLDRTDLSIKFSAITLCAIIPGIWIASVHGSVWALGFSLSIIGLSTMCATVVQVYMLGGRLSEFISALAPAYMAGLVMVAALLCAKTIIPLPVGVLRLVCLVAVGLLTYVGWIITFHRQHVIEAWHALSPSRV